MRSVDMEERTDSKIAEVQPGSVCVWGWLKLRIRCEGSIATTGCAEQGENIMTCSTYENTQAAFRSSCILE